MNRISRRARVLSPRSISGRRIVAFFHNLVGPLPPEQAGSGCGCRDELEGSPLASSRPENARNLVIRNAVRRLSDLAREIIVRSFDRCPARRSCRNAPTQRRVGFSRTLENPLSQRIRERIMMGSTGHDRRAYPAGYKPWRIGYNMVGSVPIAGRCFSFLALLCSHAPLPLEREARSVG